MHWVDVRGSGLDCQCGPLSVDGTCGVEMSRLSRSDACSLFTEPTIGGRSGLGFGTTTVCDARPNGVRCAFAPSTLGTSFGFPVCRLGSGSTGSAVFAGTIRTRIPRQLASLSGFVSVLLIGISALFWSEPATGPDTAIDWTFRIGGAAGALLLLVHLLRTPADPSLREKMERVLPATDSTCPFCRTPLLGGERWSCPGCGVVRVLER